MIWPSKGTDIDKYDLEHHFRYKRLLRKQIHLLFWPNILQKRKKTTCVKSRFGMVFKVWTYLWIIPIIHKINQDVRLGPNNLQGNSPSGLSIQFKLCRKQALFEIAM